MPKLRRFGLALTGSRADADDLVQNACERALRRADQLRDHARLDAWIYGIMRNLWTDEIRARRVRAHESLDATGDIPGTDGAATADGQIMLATVRRCLDRLSAEHRSVLILVCVDGLSYRRGRGRSGHTDGHGHEPPVAGAARTPCVAGHAPGRRKRPPDHPDAQRRRVNPRHRMTDIESLLMAYVDGELDAEAAAEVERLIANDAAARRSVDIYRQTTALLRAACAESTYASASPPMKSAVTARRVSLWRRPVAAAASVAMLLAGYAAGWMTAPHSAEASFIDDVAEYHEVYSRESTHLAEVPASQSDEISRWLGDRLRRPVNAPDLGGAGLTFAGARMWISDGKPVADLLYTRTGALPVALCIVREPDAPAPKANVEQTMRGDLRVAYWRGDGYTFALVGDLTAAQARDLAERARSQGQLWRPRYAARCSACSAVSAVSAVPETISSSTSRSVVWRI